jgi:hypothetical protein
LSRRGLALLLCGSLILLPRAGATDEADDLRQRLTEREDKRRPIEPFGIELGGRTLVVGGEYEIALGGLRRRVLGAPARERDRVLLEQGLELETFYSFGPPLSLFAQLRGVMEEDLLSHTFEGISDLYVERGEMWLYAERLAGLPLHLDAGRLDFEDERRWWWDQELDAIRLTYERESHEVAVALAREVAPHRSDLSHVTPEQDRVLRLIGEASWDFAPNQALELFLLHQVDRSETPRPGAVVSTEREDESDARLTWLGARTLGAFDLGSRGILGYWLDTALVRGEERRVSFETLSPSRSMAVELLRRDVRGFAIDAGLSALLPAEREPRLFAGLAFGSGDSSSDRGTDRSFRQSGLQANEAGFGGVQRFPHYGVVLDPELSNLGVLTLGGGLSVLRSSSIDLVLHQYRLARRADSLRDAGLDLTLTGDDRDLGQELDLVLALEEWEHLELELSAGVFRAGEAFGPDRGRLIYGGAIAVRFAF